MAGEEVTEIASRRPAGIPGGVPARAFPRIIRRLGSRYVYPSASVGFSSLFSPVCLASSFFTASSVSCWLQLVNGI